MNATICVQTKTLKMQNFILISQEEKILGVIIALSLAALSRLVNYLELEERKLILKSKIKSQFTNCPLVLMFCSGTSNNLINKIHRCFSRLILNGSKSSFVECLHENNGILNHQRNI